MLNDLSPSAVKAPHDPYHAWAGNLTPESLKTWVDYHIQAHRTAIDHLLAVREPRTAENTLLPYDQAIAALGIAGSEAGLLHSVCQEKAVRDQAEAMVQAVSEAAVQLSLNPQVYHALSSIDATKLDTATKHYLERTLLQYRLAGVDKDQTTREKIQQLQERITELGLTFGRNVQEQGNTVIVEDANELDGLPQDFLARHAPDAEGHITLTTDYPDYQPVMTFAKSDALRRKMFLAYNTRAYPANKPILMDILATRKQLANTLGFDSWANLATADQMMGSAANVKAFLAELDAASKPGASREYAMVLEFVQKQRPGLTAIDASSAMYWYEQYRRAAFDFDSQSVRPYFPYRARAARHSRHSGEIVSCRVSAGATGWTGCRGALGQFCDGVGRIRSSGRRRQRERGEENWPVLSGHASARRQGQMVLRVSAGAGNCGRAGS